MNVIEDIHATLRSALCAPLEVAPVPIGFAINTGFPLPDGDMLSFYLVADEDGRFHLEDDGLTMPNAIASGLDLKSPIREGLLRGLLSDEGARLDDDLTIRSLPFSGDAIGLASMKFISALIRTRDLTLINRENVAASFADDLRRDLAKQLPDDLILESDKRTTDPVAPDFILRVKDTHKKAARIYAAGADLRLMDALVGYRTANEDDSPVIAVVDRRRGRVSEKRFNAATNLGLPMAVVDGSNNDWIPRVVDVANRYSRNSRRAAN